ncbi:MAG: methyl-accepting chemotaxis protein [Comamonas sp.]
MAIRKHSVATRMWTVILGIVLVLAAVAFTLQNRTASAFKHALDDVEAMDRDIATVLQWRGNTEVAVTLLIASIATTDQVLADNYGKRFKTRLQRSADFQVEAEKHANTPERQAALGKISAERQRMLELTAQSQKLAQQGALEASRALVTKEIDPQAARYVEAQDAYVALLQREMLVLSAQADKVSTQYAVAGAVAIAASVLVALWLVAQLVRSIAGTLHQASELANAIAEGDLTQSASTERQDELGMLLRSLSFMSERLRTVVGEVRSGVEMVSTASSEIASGNHDLSQRTEQTAANLEETAASMEELTATVTQAADTARQANQLANSATQAAQRGSQVVGQVVSSMEQITHSSRRISDIIGVIDGIAFQTNILALNAAVEAARAGEQGRGFAVVAGEVRTLASRSAEAAKEIKQLILNSVASVEAGSQQVEQAGLSMSEIVSSVNRASDLINEISASATEQREGISQVNQAVAQLDHMTQQNAALVEQSSAAATSMHEQARRLEEVVSIFRVSGSAAPAGRAAYAALAPAHAAAQHRSPAAAPGAARRTAALAEH